MDTYTRTRTSLSKSVELGSRDYLCAFTRLSADDLLQPMAQRLTLFIGQTLKASKNGLFLRGSMLALSNDNARTFLALELTWSGVCVCVFVLANPEENPTRRPGEE